MTEFAGPSEHYTQADADATRDLRLVNDGFKRIARLRERAGELRQSFDNKAEAYDPIDTIAITGGSRLVSGFVGMVLRDVATEVHADFLEERADRLA